jgi:hypothetical protein
LLRRCTLYFMTRNDKIFSQEKSHLRFYDYIHRRTRTQDSVTENGKVFPQEKSYPINFITKMTKRFSPGEVVPTIWWVQILQENSYPNIDEYKVSWRSRTIALIHTYTTWEAYIVLTLFIVSKTLYNYGPITYWICCVIDQKIRYWSGRPVEYAVLLTRK